MLLDYEELVSIYKVKNTFFYVLKLLITDKYLYLLIQFTYNKIKSHTQRQLPLLHIKMIFKLNYTNQTHLYNKSISLQSLFSYTKKVFRGLPENFTFIYQSPKGQMTYIENDADLIGLKYCCSAGNDFIVKLIIMEVSQPQHMIFDQEIETLNLVRQNIRKLEDDIFQDIQNQDRQQAIKSYLSKTYQKISNQLAQEEQNKINSQIRIYLQNLYEVSAKNAIKPQISFVQKKPKGRKSVRFSPQKPIICEGFKSQKTIDELVDEKVLGMIPSIVQKIYAKMQQKLNKKCKKCIKKQLQIQNMIDQQIKKRISSSLNMQQNPEQ